MKIICEICKKEYTPLSLKVHVRKQHGVKYSEYKQKYIDKEIKKRFCLNCKKDIHDKHFNVKYCSNECKRIFYINSKNDEVDLPTCKICGMRANSLVSHITRVHKLTIEEYKKQYNCDNKHIFSDEYLNNSSERIKGENNPGYQHGGKLSPFSKKFINYDEQKCKLSKEKAAKNREHITQTSYWIKRGYTEDEAIQIISKRQSTFSLKKCIEKYGEVDGTLKWKQRQIKWLNSYKRSNFSKVSQEVFWKISEYIEDMSDIYFAELDKNKQKDVTGANYEYNLDVGDTFIKPDFLIKSKNKIIEFDGEYWHGIKRGNQERDRLRDEKLIEMGYKVLHIKERDWKNNQECVIKECLEFMNG